MSFCEKCGVFKFRAEKHRCPPRWMVWEPQQGEEREDAGIYHAADAESAAEKWADETDNCGDYTILQGEAARVLVAKESDGPLVDPVEIEVTGESVAQYMAKTVSRAAIADEGEKT